MAQLIIRKNEHCNCCGSLNSFRKRRTMVVRGERRIYLICKICKAKAVAIYPADE